jgi:hypothetical protein
LTAHTPLSASMVFVNDLLSVEEWKESVAYRGSLEREELGQYELTFFLQAEELIDLVRQLQDVSNFYLPTSDRLIVRHAVLDYLKLITTAE